ncbi:hypothetical protein CCP3SC1_520015 [Gammaproteobacteria bacterium]
MKRIPGFVERKFDCDLGIEPAYQGDGEITGLNLVSLFHGVRILFLLNRSICRRLINATRTMATLTQTLDELDAVDLKALDDAALATHVQTLVESHYRTVESSYFNTIYDNSNAATLFHDALEKYNRKAARPVNKLHLVGGLNDVSHLWPVYELWGLSRRLRAMPGLPRRCANMTPIPWWHTTAITGIIPVAPRSRPTLNATSTVVRGNST